MSHVVLPGLGAPPELDYSLLAPDADDMRPLPTSPYGDPLPRYYLTDELIASFSQEQLNKQIAMLGKTSGFVSVLPPCFVIRTKMHHEHIAVKSPVKAARDFIDHTLWLGPTGDVQAVMLSRVSEMQMPGLSYSQKRDIIDARQELPLEATYDRSGLQMWFERDSWLVYKAPIIMQTLKNELIKRGSDISLLDRTSVQFARMLEICLRSRSVGRVVVEPKEHSEKWKRSGLAAPRSESGREITLHCPRRVYTGEHGGSHASPMMHFRAEHQRQQAHGPGLSLRKEITIEATWVNAADVPPEERGTPIQHFKLTV